jgi:hypothetical protein
MTYIDVVLQNWVNFGIHILIVFLLVFTVVFAILQKMSLFGSDAKKSKRFDSAIALVIAAFVILDPTNTAVKLLQNAIPHVAIWLIAILAFFLLIGLFGGTPKWMGNSFFGLIAIGAALVVAFIFLHSAGFITDITNMPGFGWLNDPQTVSTIVVLLTFVFIIWFVTKGDDEEGDGTSKPGFGDALKTIAKSFGGK